MQPPTGIVDDRQKQILTDVPNRYLIISIPQPAKGERSGPCDGRGLYPTQPAEGERSDFVPVGGCTPDRNDPPTQEHWRSEGNGKGWAREGGTNSEAQTDTWRGGAFRAFESLSKYLAGVDRSGRGCNPRPALLMTGSAGTDSLTTGNDELFEHRQRKAESERVSKYLAGVDRSGRGTTRFWGGALGAGLFAEGAAGGGGGGARRGAEEWV